MAMAWSLQNSSRPRCRTRGNCCERLAVRDRRACSFAQRVREPSSRTLLNDRARDWRVSIDGSRESDGWEMKVLVQVQKLYIEERTDELWNLLVHSQTQQFRPQKSSAPAKTEDRKASSSGAAISSGASRNPPLKILFRNFTKLVAVFV